MWTNVISHIRNYRPSHHVWHPRLSSCTSQQNFVINETDWMHIIFHNTTCTAIHTHLISHYACIQSAFQRVKDHNWLIKSWSRVGLRHFGIWWTIILHISWSIVRLALLSWYLSSKQNYCKIVHIMLGTMKYNNVVITLAWKRGISWTNNWVTKIESCQSAQNKAVWLVISDWSWSSSMTAIKSTFHWEFLQERRAS